MNLGALAQVHPLEKNYSVKFVLKDSTFVRNNITIKKSVLRTDLKICEEPTVEARISCGQQLMRKDLHTFGSSNLVPETPAPSGPRRDGNHVNG